MTPQAIIHGHVSGVGVVDMIMARGRHTRDHVARSLLGPLFGLGRTKGFAILSLRRNPKIKVGIKMARVYHQDSLDSARLLFRRLKW
ncbi:hypothetical protein WU87_06380 [Corynebacterium minutissimum]|uniref:Uncharacterized protein n=1 Tax=Corynebacterium minutissimum TaxID=38301 RepID=A0ACC4UBP0_9CORY|nr:hypothetical protein WU87_06380 [Corynebacterium minutissimum]